MLPIALYSVVCLGHFVGDPNPHHSNHQKSPLHLRKSPDEVYAECKRFFSCRFLYLLGPPGAPVEQMAGTLEKQYGYSAINLTTLLRSGGMFI